MENNKLSSRYDLVILSAEEQNIYFNSKWYKDHIKNLRHKLIDKRIIVRPAFHKNNPKAYV